MHEPTKYYKVVGIDFVGGSRKCLQTHVLVCCGAENSDAGVWGCVNISDDHHSISIASYERNLVHFSCFLPGPITHTRIEEIAGTG